jgi:hypothetical protein
LEAVLAPLTLYEAGLWEELIRGRPNNKPFGIGKGTIQESYSVGVRWLDDLGSGKWRVSYKKKTGTYTFSRISSDGTRMRTFRTSTFKRAPLGLSPRYQANYDEFVRNPTTGKWDKVKSAHLDITDDARTVPP